MPKTETASVLVRMPPRLKEKIASDAWKRKTNMTATINSILAEHYNVRYTPSNRRQAPFGGGARK